MDVLGVLEVVGRNLSWMTGNMFLAWSAVLFAMHLRGPARRRRIAGYVLVASATIILAVRLGVRDTYQERPVAAIAAVVAVFIVAATWSHLAQRDGRIAHWIGYVGVIAFAPNAPYVLSDLFHHAQDLRLTGTGLLASLLLAVQYGWFLVLGAASWVLLIDLLRDWLVRHGSRLRPVPTYLTACLAFAFGIYLGRIERFHSWHPLQDPGRFIERVMRALTSPGPLAFTAIWWIAIAAIGVCGLWLLDRLRDAEGSRTRFITWTSWLVVGVLLASTSLVAPGYAAVGVDVAQADPGIAFATLVVGFALSTIAALRLAMLLDLRIAPERRGAVAGVLALTLPAIVVATAFASTAQWYVQFRGLCEFSPNPQLHGDSC